MIDKKSYLKMWKFLCEHTIGTSKHSKTNWATYPILDASEEQIKIALEPNFNLLKKCLRFKEKYKLFEDEREVLGKEILKYLEKIK